MEEYLFGSYAKKSHSSESDIDILLIVKDFKPDMQYRISCLASEYSLAHNVVISPIVRDFQSWEKNKNYNTLFYTTVR